MELQKVAITGGAGFIGCHLVRQLLALGVPRIVVLDSFEYGSRANLPEDPAGRVEVVEHRLCSASRPALLKALNGVDALFHLAAEKHNQSIDNPLKVIDANIAGTHELLAAAKECGVRKVVFTSSLYAYGRMSGAPFVETEIPRPETVYGMSKLSGEGLCHHFFTRHGLPSVSLRYMFVYGPRQFARQGYKSVIVKTFERLLAGQPPVVNGDGRQVLDYLFVDEVVRATLAAMTAPVVDEVINIGSGEGRSVNELIARIQKVAGTSYDPMPAPADVTHGSYRVCNNDRMKKLLSVTPTVSLDDGLSATFAWMKANASKR